MTNHIREIPLDSVETKAPVTVISAEMPEEYPTPFARVLYAVNGQNQEKRLRFDIDKQVFIDHPENARADRSLRNAAPDIAKILGSDRLNQLVKWLNNSTAQKNFPKPEDYKDRYEE